MKSRSRPGKAASTDQRPVQSTTVALELDHLDLITRRPACRAAVAGLRKLLSNTEPEHTRIWHEQGLECCQMEPWPVTAARLVRMLSDDGVSALWLLAPPGGAL